MAVEGRQRFQFQSTHPLRGATHSIAYLYECLEFQSTHPLRGATNVHYLYQFADIYFNPRTPCGVRRKRSKDMNAAVAFQSTHPLRGATYLMG